MPWAEIIRLYGVQGILGSRPEPLFRAASNPRKTGEHLDPELNAEETRVYAAGHGGLLVLGWLRNLRSEHLLVYAVLIQGKVSNVDAVTQARSVVTELGRQAKLKRFGPPRPEGAVADGPEHRLQGPQIQQLLTTIQQSSFASPRVKEMSASILPLATSVTLTRWRTAAPLSNADFFNFYIEQAADMGWGRPVVRDESLADRPSLIFQLPGGTGVVMIRSQPTGAPVRPVTIIHVLYIEGRIDTSKLKAG